MNQPAAKLKPIQARSVLKYNNKRPRRLCSVLTFCSGPCNSCGAYVDYLHAPLTEAPRLLCPSCCPCNQSKEKEQTTMTTPTTKPAQEIEIRNWRTAATQSKGCLGYFTAVLPSGMILHDLTLRETKGEEWISFPAREWTNQAGEKKYSPYIAFVNRETQERFQQQILNALDKQQQQPKS